MWLLLKHVLSCIDKLIYYINVTRQSICVWSSWKVKATFGQNLRKTYSLFSCRLIQWLYSQFHFVSQWEVKYLLMLFYTVILFASVENTIKYSEISIPRITTLVRFNNIVSRIYLPICIGIKLRNSVSFVNYWCCRISKSKMDILQESFTETLKFCINPITRNITLLQRAFISIISLLL